MSEKNHRKNSLVWSIPDDEFKNILNNNKGFEKIGFALGFKNKPGSASRKEIRKRAIELNIPLPKNNPNLKTKTLPKQNIKKENTKISVCKNCGVKIRNNSKSKLCQQCYREMINSEKIKTWKETGNTRLCMSNNS